VPKASEKSDLTELVDRIVAGDQNAEDDLVSRYKEGISIIIRRIIQSQAAVEDLSQETFTIALEKIRRGDVREPERLSGFICGVARNLAKDQVQRMRRLTKQVEIGEAEQIPDPAPNQLEQLCQKERAALVRQVIDELKVERDRDVIFRYYIDEEDKDRICADLDMTREQFSRVIFRALNRYKELYVKLFGGP
jgi:RNA polymerase sigma-70 factor, ECF subfamily